MNKICSRDSPDLKVNALWQVGNQSTYAICTANLIEEEGSNCCFPMKEHYALHVDVSMHVHKCLSPLDGMIYIHIIYNMYLYMEKEHIVECAFSPCVQVLWLIKWWTLPHFKMVSKRWMVTVRKPNQSNSPHAHSPNEKLTEKLNGAGAATFSTGIHMFGLSSLTVYWELWNLILATVSIHPCRQDDKWYNDKIS